VASRAEGGEVDWRGFAIAALGSIAFSGKTIIVKLAYRHGVDALTLIMLRMLFALPLFVALAWWAGRGKAPLAPRDRLAVFGLGFCGYYLASTLDFLGLQHVSAGLGRLIQYLTPTVVLAIGVAWLGKRATRGQLVALSVSYVGVLLVFGREVAVGGSNTWLGSALVFGSVASYAVYLVSSGELVKRVGAARLVGLATSVACLLCIAQFLLLRPIGAATGVAPAVVWLSVLNALACTFLPVTLTMVAIDRIGASAATQVGMIGPLSTIAMGVVLLDEPFTAWILAGTALVVVGIWLLARQHATSGRIAPATAVAPAAPGD
jgi:drug/metabolite transporter (DMT)-like permease